MRAVLLLLSFVALVGGDPYSFVSIETTCAGCRGSYTVCSGDWNGTASCLQCTNTATGAIGHLGIDNNKKLFSFTFGAACYLPNLPFNCNTKPMYQNAVFNPSYDVIDYYICSVDLCGLAASNLCYMYAGQPVPPPPPFSTAPTSATSTLIPATALLLVSVWLHNSL